MTVTEIQDIVRRLSNQTWCRYWLNFHGSRHPVWMAIQCRDESGKPEPVADLLKIGFVEQQPVNCPHLYFIKRTSDDGTDYVSELF